MTYAKERVFIIYNINNDLITNVDLKKETQYLIALNNQLKNLSTNKILNIAKDSILRETVKKIEIEKYFDLKKNNPIVDNYIKNFYTKLNLNNEIEFQEYLQSNGLTMNFVKKKIQIEVEWNKLIYSKFKNQLNIDKEKIRKEILMDKNEEKEKLYLLSEIVFEIDNQNNLNEKKDNINNSINEIGFKNSANIYSISDSSKFGGQIGWVSEKDLSKKIFTKINNLKVGEQTLPINMGASFLILKIDDIKFEKKLIDVKQVLSNKIEIETERQLQRFSKIYFNQVKINTNINEL
ncbi:peptidylprolyl isomerase [Candidatus Pelagibacter sp.]|nr:peptidylprolyl isomerase [Candidatus Pelagibacter sp.]